MANLVRVFKDAKSGDNASITADPNGKTQKKVAAQETWTVIYDGVVNQVTASTAAGLPVAGFVYGGLFCTSVQATRQTTSPYTWKVAVSYENLQKQDSGNNTVWNLNIKKSSAAREETATRDRLDLPLCNTFGELLPQLPPNALFDEVWNISWSTSVAPDWGDIDGKCNSDACTFTICGITRNFTKSQVKVVGSGFSSTKIISDTSGDTKQYTFIYNCELTLQVRKPKWVWNAPNEGWRGKSGAPRAEPVPAVTFHEDDHNLTPKAAPTKMDLLGFALPNGASILKLPDDAIGQATLNAGRVYAADGAFELEHQVALSPLLSKLVDSGDNA